LSTARTNHCGCWGGGPPRPGIAIPGLGGPPGNGMGMPGLGLPPGGIIPGRPIIWGGGPPLPNMGGMPGLIIGIPGLIIGMPGRGPTIPGRGPWPGKAATTFAPPSFSLYLGAGAGGPTGLTEITASPRSNNKPSNRFSSTHASLPFFPSCFTSLNSSESPRIMFMCLSNAMKVPTISRVSDIVIRIFQFTNCSIF